MRFRDHLGGREATRKEGEKLRGMDREVSQVRLGRQSWAGPWQGLGCTESEMGTSPDPVTNNLGIVFVPEMYSYFPPCRVSVKEHSLESYYLQNARTRMQVRCVPCAHRSPSPENVSATLCPVPWAVGAASHSPHSERGLGESEWALCIQRGRTAVTLLKGLHTSETPPEAVLHPYGGRPRETHHRCPRSCPCRPCRDLGCEACACRGHGDAGGSGTHGSWWPHCLWPSPCQRRSRGGSLKLQQGGEGPALPLQTR